MGITTSHRESSSDVAVVGVGAHAGGIPAFEEFLRRVPGDPDVAFVLVYDDEPSEDERGIVPRLSESTPLPVCEATDGTVVEANHVYTAPPGRCLELDAGRLRVRPREEGGRIDAFFRSLASARGEMALGVLLAPRGADGARGMKDIQRAGGVTLAQRVDEDATVEEDPADFILPLEEIADALVRYACHPLLEERAESREALSRHVDSVVNLLLARTGYDFRHYKDATVNRRIARRMGIEGIEAVPDYVAALKESPEEVARLYKDLLVGGTRFFREMEAWRSLEDGLLDELVDARAQDGPLRAWIAGCSTGEEAYSLGMVLLEAVDRSSRALDLQFFGTDVDEEALDVARHGSYSRAIDADVSPERLKRFFVEEAGGYHVSRGLRDTTVFARHDVLRDQPFHGLDLVSCRNLLTQLDVDAQARALELFHFALRDGGYLFLGRSESAAEAGALFEAVPRSAAIYRKRVTGRRRSSAAAATSPRTGSVASGPGREIERGLRETRKKLQKTIEELERSNAELEFSNEEVLSINEELRTVNAELETSQGDLRSLNEELAAVNRELADKVVELETTADDLSNFLASTQIATIFLDPRFRIRRFTPAMNSVLSIIPSDVGRRLSELSHRVQDADLLADAELVLSELVPIEKEVGSDDGRWFIRRILPYRMSSGDVDGVVVTFTDVTRLKETRERLERRERQQAVVVALGSKAASEAPLNDLMDEAVARVADTLDNEISKVLQLSTDGSELRLVSGVGWNAGLVGKASVPSSVESQAGYTLQAKWPVVVDDLSRESRFSGPELLLDHGVQSGLSVVIGPNDRPWGVLGTHSRRRQVYTDDDVNFVQSVAHLLWQAIAADRSRKAEKEHKEELALIADSVPVLIAYVDSELRYRFNNAAYERWFGVPRSEIQGRAVKDFLGEDTFGLVGPHARKALAGERVTFELEVTDRGGRTRATLMSYVPRKTTAGRVHGFYAVGADVTELKQAEERVRESEERLRLSQQAGGIATWDWDVAADVVICSEEFFEIYGTAPKERLSYEEWTERLDPRDRDEVEARLRETLEGRTPFETEFRILRPEGVERWIAGRAGVVRDDDGRPERVVGVHIDVTARKLAELLSETAQAELARASRLKDEFLAMLGHELRNPLGAISNGIQLLTGGATGENRDWVERMIARQARQLERLVDDLLDVSRFTRGLIEVRKEVVPLSRCVEQALESVRDLVAENDRALEVRVPEEAVYLMADPARMEQILGNLLSNAIKYTDDGGRIELAAERAGDEVVVRVSDDGVGIPESALPLVFEPFVRVGQSLRATGSGLGIGLTLVKKLVELHGGSVTARSEGPGKGSEFVVTLPFHVQGPAASVEESATSVVAAASLRILVVDDNRDLALGIQKVLQALGHDVRLAHDGPEGIDVARRFHPQAALVDIGLPGMDGYEVAARLRETDRMWIGAVSGYKPRDDEGQTRGVFDRYFIKPVDHRSLAEALSALSVSREVGP